MTRRNNILAKEEQIRNYCDQWKFNYYAQLHQTQICAANALEREEGYRLHIDALTIENQSLQAEIDELKDAAKLFEKEMASFQKLAESTQDLKAAADAA